MGLKISTTEEKNLRDFFSSLEVGGDNRIPVNDMPTTWAFQTSTNEKTIRQCWKCKTPLGFGKKKKRNSQHIKHSEASIHFTTTTRSVKAKYSAELHQENKLRIAIVIKVHRPNRVER